MFTQYVKYKFIFDRLNAEAYAPEHLKCSQRLKESGLQIIPLGIIVSKKINNSIRGVNGHLNLQGSSIPMFRPADIHDGIADPDSAPKISVDFEKKYEKSRVYTGDIVLGIAGTVGCVGRVPVNVVYGNINGSSARISINNDYESAFFLAYFLSRYGQSSLLQFCVGSVQKHINLEDIPLVTVCKPIKFSIQYIGDKVRQAERLRGWAKKNLILIDDFFSFLSDNPIKCKKYWVASKWDLDSYRINPKQYDPVVIDLVSRAQRNGVKLHKLSDLVDDRKIRGGATPKGSNYCETGVFFCRVQNVKPYIIDNFDAVYIDSKTNDELSRSKCSHGDIVFTITGYPGTAALVQNENLPLNINQHSVRFSGNSYIQNGYLCAALNSNFLKYQVNRSAIGGTRDALDYPSINRLLIPRFSKDTESKIDVMAHNYVAASNFAKRLTTAAKLLVEALIEGQLAEGDLVAAQEALEAGDESLDRGILGRLKTDGVDGRGQAVFADLDEMYRLLREAGEGQG